LYARCIATIRRIVNNVNIMHGIIFKANISGYLLSLLP
jgi:hypothetical protein